MLSSAIKRIRGGTVLELANIFEVPVTTRGAGSTLTGSATPNMEAGYWI